MSNNSNSLKERGNDAFGKGKFEEALNLYSQAIKVDPSNHVLFSNRSATFFALHQYQKALEDAETGINLKPDWPKNYLRKASALFALHRYGEIFAVVAQGKKYDEKIFEDILEQTKEQLKLEQYYGKHIPHKQVSVRNIDKYKGKGVFAEQNFNTKEIIFTEKPLICVQKPENRASVLACNHCLTFIGVLKTEHQDNLLIFPPYSEKCDYIVKEPINCTEGCHTFYCRKEAHEKYHSLICPGSQPHPEDPFIIFETHAYQTSYRFVLAMRAIAYIIQHSKEVSNDLMKSMEIFTRFTKASWSSISHYDSKVKKYEHEEQADHTAQGFSALKRSVLMQSLEFLRQTRLFNENYALLFSYDFYSDLMGMIELNGAHLEALPSKEHRAELMKKYACSEQEVPHSAGIGLFALHGCLNHSCKPNAEVVGGIIDMTDATIKVVALRTIKKDDEVVISYIEAPNKKVVDERQKELKAGYLFDCKCSKCLQEKE